MWRIIFSLFCLISFNSYSTEFQDEQEAQEACEVGDEIACLAYSKLTFTPKINSFLTQYPVTVEELEESSLQIKELLSEGIFSSYEEIIGNANNYANARKPFLEVLRGNLDFILYGKKEAFGSYAYACIEALANSNNETTYILPYKMCDLVITHKELVRQDLLPEIYVRTCLNEAYLNSNIKKQACNLAINATSDKKEQLLIKKAISSFK